MLDLRLKWDAMQCEMFRQKFGVYSWYRWQPIEYLSQIPESKIGESILLMSLIYGSDPDDPLDDYSLFSIIESLERINRDYTNQFVFEYFINNSL